MTRRAVSWAAAVLAAAVLTAALVLGLGFRLFAILTPSMGQTAPVGSLVVTHSGDRYGVGDVVSFERVSRVYAHRIVEVTGDGSFITKGDLNGVTDPWVVPPADVIGRAVWIAPGLGWVLRGLPWLALGFALVWGLSLIRRPTRIWRWVIRISGWTLVVALVAAWLRPWVSLNMLGFVPADDQGVLMHVVNTGLFPVDAIGARLVSGQDAIVHVIEQDASGRFSLVPAPALSLWHRLVLLAVCLIPLAASFVVRPEEDELATSGAAAGTAAGAGAMTGKADRRRTLLIGAIVVTVVLAVAAVNQTLAYGAFAASIRNTIATTGTNSWFTCARAETSTANGVTPYLVWAASTTATTSTNQTDLSGNTRTGRYTTAATINTTNYGCQRDTPKAAVLFNGDKCLYTYQNYQASNYTPDVFSLEAWFRTSTKSNGKVIGFGNSRNSASDSTYDRHVYIDPDGRVVFGVYTGGAVQTVTTNDGKDYADGNFHHVVATLSTAGEFIYVDGKAGTSKTGVTAAEDQHGYWKVGCGALSGWQKGATGASGSTTQDYNGPSYFTGWIQYAAVYSTALSEAQAKAHYYAGR
jgi:signal peptidase I